LYSYNTTFFPGKKTVVLKQPVTDIKSCS